MDKPVLHLNLTRQWFDMIASGEKKEEYRDLSDHWKKFFGRTARYVKLKGKRYTPEEINICFSNGYAKNRRQMIVSFKSMTITRGNPNWGAEPTTMYYVLKLGEILKKNF